MTEPDFQYFSQAQTTLFKCNSVYKTDWQSLQYVAVSVLKCLLDIKIWNTVCIWGNVCFTEVSAHVRYCKQHAPVTWPLFVTVWAARRGIWHSILTVISFETLIINIISAHPLFKKCYFYCQSTVQVIVCYGCATCPFCLRKELILFMFREQRAEENVWT